MIYKNSLGLGAQVHNHPVKLPSSKRTKSLLAYLLITAKPYRRDHLCEVFWETPDDPRGALRWSLSKIRDLLNDEHGERFVADRQQVSLDSATLKIDYSDIHNALNSADAS